MKSIFSNTLVIMENIYKWRYKMKKTLLLSGIACLAAFSAEAMSFDMNSFRPYVGADYVFFRPKNGSSARHLKDKFHAGKFNVGVNMYKNWDLEFSFQQSGELKSGKPDASSKIKNYFTTYAMDLYGKYPIMCSKFNALATVGAAIYHVKYSNLDKTSFDRVGYRAGLGVQYDFNDNMSARVVGRYSYVGSAYVNNLMEVTAGLQYRF